MATTSTATARTGSPASAHAPPARRSVRGTKTTASRSASRTKGAEEAWASATRRTRPAYVDRSAVAVASRSSGAPALTAPLRTTSPAGCSTGRGSPVSADSSSVAGPSRRPSTGTIPRAHQEGVARRHLVDRHLHEPAGLAPLRRARRALQQQAQLAAGARLGPGLEQLAGREHHGDDRAGEELPDRERPGQRQQGDHVDGGLPAAQGGRRPRERGGRGRGPCPRTRVRRPLRRRRAATPLPLREGGRATTRTTAARSARVTTSRGHRRTAPTVDPAPETRVTEAGWGPRPCRRSGIP